MLEWPGTPLDWKDASRELVGLWGISGHLLEKSFGRE
jgi:hypothetical protein